MQLNNLIPTELYQVTGYKDWGVGPVTETTRIFENIHDAKLFFATFPKDQCDFKTLHVFKHRHDGTYHQLQQISYIWKKSID